MRVLLLCCLMLMGMGAIHTTQAQLPKIKKPKIKAPKVKVPKGGSNNSGGSASSPVSTESPAKSAINTFERHAKNLQEALDNGVWKVGGNDYDDVLDYALGALKEIKEKDAKKAPKYQEQYDKYFTAWDKHLDAEAEAKGIRRRKADVSASPAAESIKDLRSELKSLKYALEQRNGEETRRVENCQKYLAEIKEKDPNWIELSLDEADFMDLKKIYDARVFTNKNYEKFRKYESTAYKLTKEPWRFEVEGIIDYNEFMADAKAYKGQGNLDEDVLSKIENVEKFLKEDRQYVMKYIKERADKNLKETEKLLKEQRTQPNYIKEFSLYHTPERHIKILERIETYITKQQVMFPDNADLNKYLETCASRKADLKEYKESGGYDKDVEKYNQMMIDQVGIGTAKRSDPSLHSIVKRDLNTKTLGTIKRISITSTDWKVRKTDWGYPTEKVMYVDCATEINGKCYKVDGEFVMTHEGAGAYGKPFWRYNYKQEMNCANINK